MGSLSKKAETATKNTTMNVLKKTPINPIKIYFITKVFFRLVAYKLSYRILS